MPRTWTRALVALTGVVLLLAATYLVVSPDPGAAPPRQVAVPLPAPTVTQYPPDPPPTPTPGTGVTATPPPHSDDPDYNPNVDGPTQAPVTKPGAVRSRDCREFGTQAAAERWWKRNGRAADMDTNGNGHPCDELRTRR